MINNVILVGKVMNEPKIKKIAEDFYACTVVLRVTKGYRDINTGDYSNDIINVYVWNGVAKLASNYIKKNDIIGIKGRLSNKVSDVDGVKKYELRVIGERIVFIDVNKMTHEEFAKQKSEEKKKKYSKDKENKSSELAKAEGYDELDDSEPIDYIPEKYFDEDVDFDSEDSDDLDDFIN